MNRDGSDSEMKEQIGQIRERSNKGSQIYKILLWALLSFILGVTLGIVAKYADSISLIGHIGTRLGVWVLIASILAAWSTSPERAALNVFAFFSGMLISYYTYSMMLFGFFPRYYFMAWGIFALLSPIGAYIVWYARGEGWIAAFCAALPIALLLEQGYNFYYTFSAEAAFDLLSVVLLFIILPAKKLQRLRVLALVAAVFFIIWRLNLVSGIFGGL
jgi:hypothetical protein